MTIYIRGVYLQVWNVRLDDDDRITGSAIVGSKRDDGVLEMDEDGNLVPLDSRIF